MPFPKYLWCHSQRHPLKKEKVSEVIEIFLFMKTQFSRRKKVDRASRHIEGGMRMAEKKMKQGG